MNITNVKPVQIKSDFQRWRFDLDGEEHHYITSMTYAGFGSRVEVKPYARVIAPTVWDTSKVIVEKFMPLDEKSPAEGIRKFYLLAMLQ